MHDNESFTVPNAFLRLHQVSHSYTQGQERLDILRNIDLQLYPGQTIALLGQSGSGKTTLLNIAGLLEKPSSGDVFLNGVATAQLRDEQRSQLRQRHLGFVYQFHFLLNDFTALENLLLPQLIAPAGESLSLCLDKGKKILDKLGLSHRYHHSPKKLSGGEQQRVAIARALVNDPKLILADEPTGNLDTHTAAIVFDQLRVLVDDYQACALIATHDLVLAEKMDRIVGLHEGQLRWLK